MEGGYNQGPYPDRQGLDLNLGGPSLQPPPGLLLNVAGHPSSGQKRQRTDDQIDPSGDSPHPGGSGDRKPKGPYFEFAKKKWETEDTFRLPDGSFWPEVQEGIHQMDHGVVICKLCQRHHKANNFAGEGYSSETNVLL